VARKAQRELTVSVVRKLHLSVMTLAVGLVGGAAFWLLTASPRAADTLPAQNTDPEFWRMVNGFSEPNGDYPFENFVSNEVSYQDPLPELKRRIKPGGVYLGVAPEQNFTYIAALEPKAAFIVDIRRQNMLELLIYKALFELSADRGEFVSRLFSRKRPLGLDRNSSAESLFRAFESAPPDPQLYAETLQAIKDRLIKQRGFKPIGGDEQKIEYVFSVFFRGGPGMDYGYASTSPNNRVPSYYNLMVATDGHGQNWAYLASEARYQFVRNMQQKNLIVPLVGDFSGPKTLKAVAQYVKEHGATVSVFYISNVENFVSANWSGYLDNLRSLPQDDSTVLIRFIPTANTLLGWIKDVPPRWPGSYSH
jgi:hypothetical protein